MSESSFKSTEELVALVNASDKFGDERDTFLKDIKLSISDNAIKCKVIYWVYLKWCRKNQKEPDLSISWFFKGWNERFKYKNKSYFVSSSEFDLPRAERKLMNSYYKAENQWRKIRNKNRKNLKKANAALKRKKQREKNKPKELPLKTQD